MANGAHWTMRGLDPEVREMARAAARASGVSLETWLREAIAERAEEAEVDPPPRRERRRFRGENRAGPSRPLDRLAERLAAEDSPDEARVAEVIDEAYGRLDARIDRAESRAAAAIEALERRLREAAGQARAADQPPGPRPLAPLFDRLSEGGYATAAPPTPPTPPAPPATAGPPAELVVPGLAKVEETLVALGRRMDALADRLETTPPPAPPPPPPPPQPDPALAALERRLETLLKRLDTPTPVAAPGDHALRHPLFSDRPALARSVQERRRELSAASSEAALGALRADLAQIARRLEREPAPNPKVDAAIEQLRREIRSLQDGLHAMTPAPMLAGLRSELRELAERVEISRQEGVREAHLQPVVTLLQDIGRAVEALRDPPAMKDLRDTLARLSDRLAAVSAQTASSGEAPTGELKALRHELAALRGLVTTTPVMPALEAMERQMHALSQRLEGLAARPDDRASGSHLLAATADLRAWLEAHNPAATLNRLEEKVERRLQDIADRLQDMGHGAVAASLDARIDRLRDDLAHRLDRWREDALAADRRAEAPVPDLSPLEALLREINAKIERGASAAPAEDVGDLHAAMAALSRQIDERTAERGDPELGAMLQTALADIGQGLEDVRRAGELAVQEAADRAAEQTLRALEPKLARPEPAPAVEAVLARQEAMEERTRLTLQAVHDTLAKVAGRLAQLEAAAKAPPAPMPAVAMPGLVATSKPVPVAAARPTPTAPAATPAPSVVASPAPEIAAPSDPIAAMREQLKLLRVEQAGAAPGASAARSGKAAEAASGARSSVATAMEAARAAMAGLTQRAAAGRGARGTPTAAAEPPATGAPASTAPSAEAARASEFSAFDLPLEPGSGRPQPGVATLAAAPGADPKARFIAAARRAAETAREQSAQAIAEETGKTDGPSGGRLKRRHVLLLGLAALVIAVGATLQVIGSFRGGPTAETRAPLMASPSPEALPPPAATPRVTTPRPEPAPGANAAPQAVSPPARPSPPPRNVTPVEPQRPASAPSRALPSPDQNGEIEIDLGRRSSLDRVPADARLSDPTTVGSVPVRVPALAPALPADDPLNRFEGITLPEPLRLAARRGEFGAMFEVADRYAEGRGGARNDRLAAAWLQRAADAGSMPALYRLGTLHREGRGVPRDALRALVMFERAGEAGHARAMHNAGVLIAEGVRGAPDYAAAARWFQRAAEHGIRDSQYNLAVLHARGLGVAQDLGEAHRWFGIAASQGDADAARKRDEISPRLSAAARARSETAIATFRSVVPDPAINDPPADRQRWQESTQATPAPVAPPSRR